MTNRFFSKSLFYPPLTSSSQCLQYGNDQTAHTYLENNNEVCKTQTFVSY